MTPDIVERIINIVREFLTTTRTGSIQIHLKDHQIMSVDKREITPIK